MSKTVSPLTKRHKIIARSQEGLKDAQRQHSTQVRVSSFLKGHGLSRGGMQRLSTDEPVGTNRAAVKRYTQAKKAKSGNWHPYGNPHAFGGRRQGTDFKGARGHAKS